MYIKDKNSLINLDKVLQIFIEEYSFDGEEPKYCIRYFSSEKCGIFSPRFSTLESAEKCFDEIIREIADNFTIIDLYDICYSIKEGTL